MSCGFRFRRGAAQPAPGLCFPFIDANNLRQKDLAPLLGSESVVSEVLSGKRGLNKRICSGRLGLRRAPFFWPGASRRELNKHHIEKLSKKFRVSPAVFF